MERRPPSDPAGRPARRLSLHAIRKVSPRAILVAGFVGFLLYAYPGIPSWDALDQLAAARRGFYSDEHPPAMAALWRLLEHFMRGPFPILLVQSLPFMAGCYYLFATRMSHRRAALATVAVLWFPPIGAVVATIVKDSTMATFVLAAAPLLLSPRRWVSACGLLLIGMGTAMRYNAIFATLPLVVLLFRAGALAGWRRYAVSALAWVAVTAGAMEFNHLLVDEEKHYWSTTHALMDIADTLTFSQDYTDAEVEQMLDGVPLAVHDHLQERLRTIYRPTDYHHLSRGPNRVFIPARTDAERDAVARAWRRVLLANPEAYLRYRWYVFIILTRLDQQSYENVWTTQVLRWHEEYEFVDYDFNPSRIEPTLAHASKQLSHTHLFDPYLYAIAALVLSAAAVVRRDRLTLALLLSGLVYEGAWFGLTPTDDYRYSQWMVAMTVIGAVLFVTRIYSTRRARAYPEVEPALASSRDAVRLSIGSPASSVK